MIKEIVKLLRILKIPISHKYLWRLISSHPDYPALTSFSDSFDQIGIDYGFAKITDDRLKEIKFPYIMYLQGHQFKVIRSKKVLEKYKDFWDGIVLKIAPRKKIIDKENTKFLRFEKLKKFSVYTIILTIISLPLGALFSIQSFFLLTPLIPSMLGLLISTFIFLKEIGFENDAINKFCKVKNSDCDSIISSEESKLWGVLSLSDASLAFFVGQLIILIAALYSQISVARNLINSSLLICLFGIPAILYSIYYQSFVSRKPCNLCNMVIFLIISLALTDFSLFYFQVIPFKFEVNAVLYFTFLGMFLLTLVVSWIRIYSLGYNKIELENVASLRVIKSPEIFNVHLHNQKKVIPSSFDREIFIGNPNANINIYLATNLLCNPCKDTHNKIDKLLDLLPSIKITFRFMRISNSTDNPVHYFIKYWLNNIHGLRDEPKLTRRLISTWYDKMNWLNFMEAHPIKNDTVSNDLVESISKKHVDWFETNEINRTPTLVLNNRVLPEVYEVEHLEGILPFIEKYSFDERIQVI